MLGFRKIVEFAAKGGKSSDLLDADRVASQKGYYFSRGRNYIPFFCYEP